MKLVRSVSRRGLSPRGRGNRHRWNTGNDTMEQGSIPAWAGEPTAERLLPIRLRAGVYPRVGGGTHRRLAMTGTNEGRVYPRVGGGTIATINDVGQPY